MSLTNWDEVLPAFDRAIEEHRKKIGDSKEAALKYLEESGLLQLCEDQQEESQVKLEKTGGTKSTF